MIRIKIWLKTTLKKVHDFLIVTAEHSHHPELSNFYGYPKERYDVINPRHFEKWTSHL